MVCSVISLLSILCKSCAMTWKWDGVTIENRCRRWYAFLIFDFLMFWRESKQKPLMWTHRIWIALSVLFLLVGFLFYRVVHIQDLFQKSDEHIYNRLLTLFYPFDPDWTKAFSSLLTLLEEQVDKQTWILLVDNLLFPLQKQTWSLVSLLDRYFPEQATLLHDVSFLSGDIHALLWMETPQTYLIVLQNTAEKRPNGWFFWSFALITLSRGRVIDITMSDSYHPGYNTPSAKILWPERFDQFLPERDVYFVWANKVWFTYHDGPHIQTLYEKSYPGKTIRWVVFLRTDMFTRLLPDFEEQLRRWQYINATVDLIRGEDRRWKKNVYLWSIEEYLKEHRIDLVKQLWLQLPSILHDQQINIYLDDVSGKMHTFLRTSWLTTRFEDDHAYFRDSNIIFNKLDTFVRKEIHLIDESDNEIWYWTGDIVTLPTLASWGIYTFVVTYVLHVSESYHTFMRSLNEEYGITLWQREEHILWLHHEWATRGNIYFPPTFRVQSIQWDVTSQRTFETPFSQNAAYEMYIGENDVINTIRITFRVN